MVKSQETSERNRNKEKKALAVKTNCKHRVNMGTFSKKIDASNSVQWSEFFWKEILFYLHIEDSRNRKTLQNWTVRTPTAYGALGKSSQITIDENAQRTMWCVVKETHPKSNFIIFILHFSLWNKWQVIGCQEINKFRGFWILQRNLLLYMPVLYILHSV